MTSTGDAIGGIIGAGIGLAIIDRIHNGTRVRTRTVYRNRRRRKKR